MGGEWVPQRDPPGLGSQGGTPGVPNKSKKVQPFTIWKTSTMNKKLLERIREIFLAKLSAKTGWGKNEVLQAYDDSVREALLELLV